MYLFLDTKYVEFSKVEHGEKKSIFNLKKFGYLRCDFN